MRTTAILQPSSAPRARLADLDVAVGTDTVKTEGDSQSLLSGVATQVQDADTLAKSAPLMHRPSVLDKRKVAASRQALLNPKRRQVGKEPSRKTAKSRTELKHREPANESLIGQHNEHPYISAVHRLQGTVTMLQRKLRAPGGDITGADIRLLHTEFAAMMNTHPLFNPGAQQARAWGGPPAPPDYYGYPSVDASQDTSPLSTLGQSLASLLSDRAAFWPATGPTQSVNEVHEASVPMPVHAAYRSLPSSLGGWVPSIAQHAAEVSQRDNAHPYTGSHQLLTQMSSYNMPGGYPLQHSMRQPPPEGERQEDGGWSLDPGSNTYSLAAAAALAGRAPASQDNQSSIELLRMLAKSSAGQPRRPRTTEQAPPQDMDELAASALISLGSEPQEKERKNSRGGRRGAKDAAHVASQPKGQHSMQSELLSLLAKSLGSS